MPDLLASLQDVLGDRYQLEGELGRGGMATVYRATDRKLNRAVAIKVLQPELALILGSDRFRREIAIATQLQHSNIVPLLDSGGDAELLYYVMPLIEGETLRDLLVRETQLSLDEALRITRAVADALGYAHARGIVHRDIKPENILLSAGQVYVVDFGIARAITLAGEDRLTSSGMVPGTPPYMSPEQADGKVGVDGRADLYALGCVMYEMLAGRPPFTGPTAQSVLAQHLGAQVPSLRVQRGTIPPGVEAVIMKVLSKVPADRFETATRMQDALNRALTGSFSAPSPAGIGSLTLPLLLVVGVAVALLWRSSPMRTRSASGVPDTARYVVFPFEHGDGVPAGLGEDQLVRDAIARWAGVTSPDQFQVREALAGAGPIDSRTAARIALQLGAGRYLRGEVTHVGDSLTIHASVYDAQHPETVLHQARARLATSLEGADTALDVMTNSLLLRSLAAPDHPGPWGTRSVPALEEFARGQQAIQDWNLDAADSAFAGAIRFDGRYAEALLWLAQVRSWNGASTPTWLSEAERASAGRQFLSDRDGQLLDAVLTHARGDVERACALYARLARQDAHDFAGWYGLANCLVRDSVVVRDRRSRSGWRFRSSYNAAVNAFERAFEILPAVHRSLRQDSYESVRRLLFTSGGRVRAGYALSPDTLTFNAYPSWEGDTLAFVPYPIATAFAPGIVTDASLEAVRHERERFRQIAVSWVSDLPGSADAEEALAIAVDMLGDPAALDTLRRARRMVSSAEDEGRLAVIEVWMQLRYALPGDLAGVQRARRLADSILASGRADPILLACVATLLGKASAAATYVRTPQASARWELPASLRGSAFPLLVFASLGGPADSLRVLEDSVTAAIDHAIPPANRATVQSVWLARAAELAFPAYRFRSLGRLAGLGDLRADAQVAWERNDSAGARRALAGIEAGRQHVSPEDWTFDALVPEAALLRDLGDDSAAAARLDPPLAIIGRAAEAQGPNVRFDPALVGSMIQALALRADLAAHRHDARTARRWAQVVAILWSDADPFLQAVVQRMRRLAQ